MKSKPLTIAQFREQHATRRGGGLVSSPKFRKAARSGIMSAAEFVASGLGKESSLQAACVAWFRSQYPNLLLFSSLNGVKLQGGGREWKRLEREGAMPGVADLLLSCGSADLHGLYIEMKTKRGKQSPAQIAFEQNALAGGYGYVMPTSLDEFKRVVKGYLENGEY